jgi:hypothetical protein
MCRSATIHRRQATADPAAEQFSARLKLLSDRFWDDLGDRDSLILGPTDKTLLELWGRGEQTRPLTAPSRVARGLVRHMAGGGAELVRLRMAGQDVPWLFRSEAEPNGDFDGAVPDPEVVAEACEACHLAPAAAAPHRRTILKPSAPRTTSRSSTQTSVGGRSRFSTAEVCSRTQRSGCSGRR